MKVSYQTLEEILAELSCLNETKDLWSRRPSIMINQNLDGNFESDIRVDHWFSEGDCVTVSDLEIGFGHELSAHVESIHKSPYVTVVDQRGDCWDVETGNLKAPQKATRPRTNR